MTEQPRSTETPERDAEPSEKPRVELSFKEVDMLGVIACCREAAKKAGWDFERIDDFHREAASNGYGHLLRTVLRYFDVR